MSVDAIRASASRLRDAGAALRVREPARVADALARAGARLADASDPLGAEALDVLPGATGLSREMVAWALSTTCGPDATLGLATLATEWTPPHAARLRAQPARLAAVVLAGNVFTSAFRAVALPLLAGVPVLAKAPSADDLFPRLLARALAEVDAAVGAAFDVVTFAGGDAACEDALFAAADVVLAYGSDHTLDALRRRAPAHVTVVPHGHGLGAAYVADDALETPDTARDAARALALDVAAYDQAGCLSPQVVLVARYGRTSPRDLAGLVAGELGALARTLPRGGLPVEVGARQLQWRGVAVARGELLEGDGFAVSYEGDGPLRMGPGHRNLLVLSAGDAVDVAERLSPLGAHLKCLGVAGSDRHRTTLASCLAAPLAPRVCRAGTMQTPPLDAPWDARDPFDGLVRWLALE